MNVGEANIVSRSEVDVRHRPTQVGPQCRNPVRYRQPSTSVGPRSARLLRSLVDAARPPRSTETDEP